MIEIYSQFEETLCKNTCFDNFYENNLVIT